MKQIKESLHSKEQNGRLYETVLSIFTQIEEENKVVNEQKCKEKLKISPTHIHTKKKKKQQ